MTALMADFPFTVFPPRLSVAFGAQSDIIRSRFFFEVARCQAASSWWSEYSSARFGALGAEPEVKSACATTGTARAATATPMRNVREDILLLPVVFFLRSSHRAYAASSWVPSD